MPIEHLCVACGACQNCALADSF
jgi:hypothetical protein